MSELYELPDGWEWIEWKYIVNIKNGKNYKGVLDKNGLYPIYGSGGIINYANSYLCNENTIIIGRKGTINSPIFVKEKFWNIDTAFGLETKKDKLIPYFLYYFTLNFNFLTLNKSTTLPSLAKSNLQKILMPIPALQEQKRIVSKLDNLFEKIDKAIALHQKNIDEADAFMGSVLNDVFGELKGEYGTKTISELFKIKSGNLLSKKNMVEGGQYNVYGGNGINGKHNQFNLSGENIIIGRVGALCGNVRYINESIWVTDNAFYVSEYLKKFNKKYLTQMLLHIDLGSTANKSAQPVISYKGINKLKLPFPPLNIQQKTVKYLDKISKKTEKLKQVQKEKMQNLVALKASILNQAFRGNL